THLQGFAASGRSLPAPPQPFGDRLDRGKERPEMRGGERGDHQSALRLPCGAFDREQAVAADLVQNRLYGAVAPPAMWPLAQQLLEEFAVTPDHQGYRAEPEHVRGTQFFGPVLEDAVEPRHPRLVEVAQPRQAWRMRQVGELAN